MLWKKNLTQSKAIQLFENKDKMLLSHICINLTVEQAFNSGAHFAILKKWNEQGITLTIATMLTELLLSVPNNMTTEDIVYMARSIVIDNENWKPDDILLIFRNAKQGKYEKIYGNFSYQDFNKWADAYAKERQNYVDNKHLSTKAPITTTIESKQRIFEDRQKQYPILNDKTEKINLDDALKSLGKSITNGKAS